MKKLAAIPFLALLFTPYSFSCMHGYMEQSIAPIEQTESRECIPSARGSASSFFTRSADFSNSESKKDTSNLSQKRNNDHASGVKAFVCGAATATAAILLLLKAQN